MEPQTTTEASDYNVRPLSEQIAALTEIEAKFCLEAIYASGKLHAHQIQQAINLAKAMELNSCGSRDG